MSEKEPEPESETRIVTDPGSAPGTARHRANVRRRAIVRGALRVADQVGLDGVTIRAVARASGTPAMSLYTHFSKKDELLDLMYEEVVQTIYPAACTTWQGSVRALCHNVRSLLLEHPHWAPLLGRAAPAKNLPQRERLLDHLTSSGFSPQDALDVLSRAGILALGLTLAELSFRDADGVSRIAKRHDNLRAHSESEPFAAENPITRAALESAPSLNLEKTFSSIVDSFVRGLEPAPAVQTQATRAES
jgi:AcrR family transcriptional regulator